MLKLSECLEENETLRIDPEYFRKEAVAAFNRLAGERRLGDYVSDGYRVVYENTKIVDRDEGVELGLPFFLQAADITTPFINDERMQCVSEADWRRYPKGRIEEGELLVEVKGRAEKVAVVPSGFPAKTLVTGTCFKLEPKSIQHRSFLLAYLLSRQGRVLKDRLKTNLLVSFIAKGDLYRLPVPGISDELLERLHLFVEKALNSRSAIVSAMARAEECLLKRLGLANWSPPEPLTYTTPSANVFAAGRLDAQFFAPRIQELIDHLSGAGTTVGTVATPRREKFDAAKHGDFDYIEIGDLDGTGTTGSSRVIADEAPSRATWFVRANDIITSTVRPIRRLSAEIGPEQDGFVCSSGFVVLAPTDVEPELLLTYLRLPVICELMDMFASASMYPAISETDLLALPFPTVDKTTEKTIVSAVQEGRIARARAYAMLEAAKRAVEIAIEDGEGGAKRYLDEVGASYAGSR